MSKDIRPYRLPEKRMIRNRLCLSLFLGQWGVSATNHHTIQERFKCFEKDALMFFATNSLVKLK